MIQPVKVRTRLEAARDRKRGEYLVSDPKCSFEEIDVCAPRVRPVSFGEPDGSYMNDTPELFAESFETMTPEQKKALEEGLKKMLNDGLAYCLRDLKSVP